jgi:hypothetical protein
MSKNVKLNGNDYLGVSTIQIPTTSGGVASFKDVDEIAVPTGSKNITENGTYDVTNFAQAIVNVATSDGSTNMDIGTFVGDGTVVVNLPTTTKRSYLLIYTDSTLAEVYESNGSTNIPVMTIYLKEYGADDTLSNGSVACSSNEGASTAQAGIPALTGKNVTFGENSISIPSYLANGKNVFANGITYKYLAW